MAMIEFLEGEGWKTSAVLTTPSQEESYHATDELGLTSTSQGYIDTAYPEGLYKHQKEAIHSFLEGEHVCLSTGTASGKSLAYFLSGIELLQREADAKILAIYPMRALGREQENRWRQLLDNAGLDASVGRIDGSIKVSRRLGILKECSVLICTPDIIHAWFFSNLSQKETRGFLSKLKLIVVDEVHTYTGVFGSNAVYLFRRLQHLMSLLGSDPQYICASATISKPDEHLHNLFGLDFTLIDHSMDSSPTYGHEIHLVTPPGDADFTSEVVQLLRHISLNTDSKFITFVDSRKQVELFASILARDDGKAETSGDEDEDGEVEHGFDTDILQKLHVLPYRAGLEERDRRQIQRRLTEGSLNGVVSTSALELGIDIPHLDTCVLVGVPHSHTSLFQRIGRVGRKQKGIVFVINTGDVHDEAIFQNPDEFLNRPLAESALYLENEYIQYIHALCLARLDGEHDEVVDALNFERTTDFKSSVELSESFLKICNQERTGQIPKTFQMMKAEAGDNPNYTFPLRDVGSQFKVEHKHQQMVDRRGSLSFGQLMREAYPGAVYYYATQPFRVTRVAVRSKVVSVRREKYYTTRPQPLPALVFPNLSPDNVHASHLNGDLLVMECDLQIRESISGFKERRGPNEFSQNYPIPVDLGIYFDQRFFSRTYFTTGVVLSHPVLDQEGVNPRLVAELIFEAFLLTIPFERQDINHSADRHRSELDPIIHVGDRFITIFDETYGSLRLTKRLLDEDVFPIVIQRTIDLARSQELNELDPATFGALEVLVQDASQPAQEVVLGVDGQSVSLDDDSNYEQVIMPGSKGLNLNRSNEEFFVERVFLTRDGLRYEGITDTHLGHLVETKCMPLASEIIKIPGVSEMGVYTYKTGVVEALSSATKVEIGELTEGEVPSIEVDVEKLRFVLLHNFTEDEVLKVATSVGIGSDELVQDVTEEWVDWLIQVCQERDCIKELLKASYAVNKQAEVDP